MFEACPPRSHRLVPLAAAAFLLAGCTMCPNPFDYCGPVPNGSAPQNDFRARSNGIIPIGAVPRPWPPLVQREADADTPVVASDTPVVAQVVAETETDSLVIAETETETETETPVIAETEAEAGIRR
ncbi:MAG: hypothetical protein WED27_08520 [Pirellulales bacterium]